METQMSLWAECYSYTSKEIDCSLTQPAGIVYSISYVTHLYKMHFGAAYGASV